VINRQFHETALVKIKLEGFPGQFHSPANLCLLQEDGSRERPVSMEAEGCEVSLPPRSIACLELKNE
jgi:hypothetical protein